MPTARRTRRGSPSSRRRPTYRGPVTGGPRAGRAADYVGRVDTQPVPDLPPVTQLTDLARGFGQCSWPAVEPGNTRVAFICTQDPTPLGTPGNRAYTFDMAEGRLYNVSSASDIIGPIGFNHGPWFVSLVTSADLNGAGTCGRQALAGRLLRRAAGRQQQDRRPPASRVQLGDAVNGSEGQLVTKDGTLIGDVRTLAASST